MQEWLQRPLDHQHDHRPERNLDIGNRRGPNHLFHIAFHDKAFAPPVALSTLLAYQNRALRVVQYLHRCAPGYLPRNSPSSARGHHNQIALLRSRDSDNSSPCLLRADVQGHATHARSFSGGLHRGQCFRRQLLDITLVRLRRVPCPFVIHSRNGLWNHINSDKNAPKRPGDLYGNSHGPIGKPRTVCCNENSLGWGSHVISS